MPSYRVYLLDTDGRVIAAKDLCCADDAQARAITRSGLRTGTRAEIWRGTCCVGHIYAHSAPKTAAAAGAVSDPA